MRTSLMGTAAWILALCVCSPGTASCQESEARQVAADAVASLSSEVSAHPERIDLLLLLATQLRHLGEPSKALELMANRVDSLDREWASRSAIIAGQCYEDLGQIAEASSAYKRAVESSVPSTKGYALLRLATYQFGRCDLDNARWNIRQARNLIPSNPEIHFQMYVMFSDDAQVRDSALRALLDTDGGGVWLRKLVLHRARALPR